MAYPFANTLGNAMFPIKSTIASAYTFDTTETDTFQLDIAVGRPLIDSLGDIANLFHLRRPAIQDANGQISVKVTTDGSTALDLSKTPAQLGLQEGTALILAAV